MKTIWIAIIIASFLSGSIMANSKTESAKIIDVFYKNKKPSLQTLEKAKTVLEKYESDYKITYYLITDPETKDLIKKYTLPETHFPFAIVVNEKYSASIEKKEIVFIGFPLFMKGIGRHEGNWSMDDLDKILKNNALLLDKNVLPESNHNEHVDEPCPGE
ncbi:hypothetical protein K8T06_11385 [bacterium]|nr:hypothetical protein [bacterium]